MKRMTAQQAPCPHPDAARDSVLFDGLQHVFRAGRVIPASRGQTRRDPSLIDTQKGQRTAHGASLSFENCRRRAALCAIKKGQGPHFSISLSNARSISENGAVSAARRGLTTISHWAPIRAR